MKLNLIGFILTGLSFFFISCEKETTNIRLPELPNEASSEGLLRDSVYYYTDYFYLWQNQLPKTFQPHSFKTADLVLKELKKYAKDGQGKPIDRFSFLDREGTINQEIQQGRLGNFGFEFRYLNDQDLYIKKSYSGSPAYNAGIRRGWKIVEINGKNNLSVMEMEKDNFEFLFNSLNADNISIKLENPNGNIVSFNLQKGLYSFDPILSNTIFQNGNDKVGYLAFDSFVTQSLIQNRLNQIFGEFHTSGVKSVIIDLRYNGGGDVGTANHISNLLAPIAVNNKLMNRYIYNETLEDDGWGIFFFFPQFFKKTNALEINRVYFLVTNASASASELLINNLKPHMDVVLIGDDRTYGKPVGYFGWDILGVDLYAVSFQTLNANNEGDYFDGMVPTVYSLDDVSKDFGNADEKMIAQALYHQRYNSFIPQALPMMRMGPKTNTSQSSSLYQTGNNILESRTPKIMVDYSKSRSSKSVLRK